MPRAPGDRRVRGLGDAGFMLLEVLAAVAIAGLALSAIGGVVAVTFAAVRSVADRTALSAAARTLLDTLPQGDALRPGMTTGTLGTTRWTIAVVALPLPPRGTSAPDVAAPSWRPASITIAATTPSGRAVRLDTVGLLRQSPP